MIQKVFPIIALAMFTSILGMGIITPLMPIYAESMGASGVWLGVIMASFGITSAICSPIVGRLSDLKGRKLFLSIGLLWYSVTSLGYIWASDVASLILVRALQGIATGMTIPLAMAYVGDLSPKGEEGKWMGYANAAFFSGFGFGPLMGGIVTEHFGMTVTFSSMGGLNLVAFLIVIIFLPEVTSRKVREEAPKLSFREMGKSNLMRGIFTFRVSEAMGRSSYLTFLPILAATYVGLSLTLVGILLSVQVLLMSLLNPIGGRIADRVNRRGMVITGNLILFLALSLIPQGSNFWLLALLAVLLACGGTLSMPAASALVVEEGRNYGMGSAMAILTIGMNIGMSLGPLVSGVAVDLVGIESAFYCAATVALLGAGLFAWFARRPVSAGR